MARLAWKELRPGLIHEVCQPGLSPLSVVRQDEAAIQRLRAAAERLTSSEPFECARWASILDLQGRHVEAQQVLKERCANEARPGHFGAIRLLTHMIQRHVQWQAERARLEQENRPSKVVPVEILPAEVSREELWKKFVQPGVPCVIRGAGVASFRTLDDLKAISKAQVPVRGCDEASAKWARLEFVGVKRFDEFLQAHIEPYDRLDAPRNSPQLFDYSIWQHCAESLGSQVSMPSKWFPVDLYTYAAAQIQPVTGSAGPTLFVAPRGSGSSLHVDTLQTNFWMALCSGRKRWRLVNRDEMSLLRPLYLADLNPVFPMDLEDGQARGVKVYETILEADDLIFVPAGWPHQVDNLETSMAISSNFIDSSNLRRSLEEAEMLANVEEDPGLLSRVLRAAVAAGTMQQLANEVLLNEPLRQFKARHGEVRTPQETQKRLLQVISISAIGIGCLCIFLGHRLRDSATY